MSDVSKQLAVLDFVHMQKILVIEFRKLKTHSRPEALHNNIYIKTKK